MSPTVMHHLEKELVFVYVGKWEIKYHEGTESLVSSWPHAVIEREGERERLPRSIKQQSSDSSTHINHRNTTDTQA